MSNLYVDVLVKGIIGEIAKVRDANAVSATAILVYVAIDTMAYLSMPSNKKINDSIDFKSWVNTYMKTDATQPYQYNAEEMWGARCAMLHSYSSYSKYSNDKKCKLYGYHDGSNHKYNPTESIELVLISTPRFASDLGEGLKLFIKNIAVDPILKERTDSRIERISQQFAIPK